MHKSIEKHPPHRFEHSVSDGYFLFIALISAFVVSTLAILLGLGFAMFT